MVLTIVSVPEDSPPENDESLVPIHDSVERPKASKTVRLIVHGTLHVLGYDHPETATRSRSAMWRKQERLVARLAGRSR